MAKPGAVIPVGLVRAMLAGSFAWLACTASAGIASAAPASCQDLAARLARVEGGTGQELSGIAARYRRAAEEQRTQIAIAEQNFQALDCGFGIGLNGQCRALGRKLQRMRANLAQLERQEAALASRDTGRSGGEARALRARLQVRGCNSGSRALPEPAAAMTPPVPLVDDGGGLFDRLYESGLGSLDANGLETGTDLDAGDGRTYATVCVRLCDGYYFPMSPASTRQEFARDSQNCSAAYPGTAMRLYYKTGGTDEPAAMLSSVGDEPYGELATAFAYRRSDGDGAAACPLPAAAPADNYTVLAGDDPAPRQRPAAAAGLTPKPWSRPDGDADPETLANAEGGLSVARAVELLAPPKPEPAAASPAPPPRSRVVRVVGPAFFPDPEAAEARQAPAPNPAP